MITYLYYLCICFFLIIFQTTVLQNFSIFNTIYDLLIPFVLYLGLFRRFGEALPAVLVMGFVMDSITGGPFGLYLTIYFWLFIIVRWVVQFLHAGSTMILPLILLLGISLENLFSFIAVTITEPDLKFLKIALQDYLGQVFWAVCTGPFLIMSINFIHEKLEKRIKEVSAQKNGYGWEK